MKICAEKIDNRLTITLELNGETFTETWVPNKLGSGTTGKGIGSQLEERLGGLVNDEINDGDDYDCEVADALATLEGILSPLNDLMELNVSELAWRAD